MTQSASETLKIIIRRPRFYLYCSGLIVFAGLAISLGDFSDISPWLRVIVGLLVFILPGGYLFALVPARESWDLIDFAGYGFSFSVALVTLLGLVTRTLSWSIDTVEFVWYGLAILGFVAVSYKLRRAGGGLRLNICAPYVALIAIIFIQVLLYAHSSALLTSESDDQNRHHAAVNGFLRDEPLGWSEPYYETDNPIAGRSYLTYWVLAQALVVEISGVPILLTSYLINPFAVIVSVAAMYIFARNLGYCQKTSLVVVILGLLGLSLVAESGKLPGNQFFVHGKMDKNLAAFALAPIAISSAWLYSQSGRWRAFLGFALSFLACAYVHPNIGGFTACIIGIYCLILLITKHDGKKYAVYIGLLILLLLLPAALLRLNTSHPDARQLEIGEINLESSVRKSGHLTLLLIALTFISVAARRSDPKSKLLLAFVLIFSSVMLPLGAWVIGSLFYQTSRLYWLMPYGCMLFFIIETVGQRFALSLRTSSLALFLALPVTAYFLQFHSRADFGRDIGNVTSEVVEFLDIAEYIDANHDERVWIAASPESEYRNRAVAMHWKIISLSRYSAERMSYYSNMPYQQAAMQRNDNFRLYKADVTVEQKLEIIDRYGVDYLLFPKQYSWMMDALYQFDKARFVQVYTGQTLRLIKVN